MSANKRLLRPLLFNICPNTMALHFPLSPTQERVIQVLIQCILQQEHGFL